MTARQHLLAPFLFGLLASLSSPTLAPWPVDKPHQLPRPEVSLATNYNSSALFSGAIREAQDPDRPIPMDSITTVGQLEDYSVRRLMDTLRDLRKRKETDRSGNCQFQKTLKEKLRLIIASLRQRGVSVDPLAIDDSEDCPPPAVKKAEVKSGHGLQTATFDTAQGKIRVYLPDDMAAGDTISGTVIAEPKGGTDEERRRNADTLNGYVVEIQGMRASRTGCSSL